MSHGCVRDIMYFYFNKLLVEWMVELQNLMVIKLHNILYDLMSNGFGLNLELFYW